MNFARNFKWQLVLVALGASLVLTARANSQEIVNTEFDTPSTSMGGNFNQPAPVAVTTADSNQQAVYTPGQAIMIRTTEELNELSTLSFLREGGLVLAIFILMVACAIVKKVITSRRNEWRSTWNPASPRNKSLVSPKPYPLHS